MFLIFGRKTKYRPLDDGRRVRRRCPACGEDADIRACERVHSYRAYFVQLFATNKAVWVCSACKEEVDLPDALTRADADAEGGERRRLAAEEADARERLAAAEQARADRRKQQADKARSDQQRVEDELAALKAKLRK